MPERSADWLAQAERDLEAARLMLQGGLYEWTCFICQQAAEKSVKALFEYLHGEAWGHAIAELLGALPNGYRPPVVLIENARVLDKYYIQPRYPNGFDRGAPKDYFIRQEAEDALRYAMAITRFCKSKIS